MGRHTSEFQDTVLSAKFKGLVTGAIKRAKLEEKSELISYKHFVEDLDLGDSFTTTLIDILVQEMAARRLRTNPSDRRLITDQTAKSLRLLSTPLRIYHERRSANRRRMSEYLTAPPEELDMEEEDELATDPTPLPEGVRVNSELFDAYTSGWASSRSRAAAPTPPLSDETASPPSLFSVSDAWGRQAATTSPLTRQPSIRRLPRSRTTEFNNFTAHRRTSAREFHGTPTASDERSTSSTRTSRRFFPLTRRPPSLQWVEPPVIGEASSSRSSTTPEPVSFPTFFTDVDPALYSYPSPQASTEREPRPRLRRGGVRPPESILFLGGESRSASDDEAAPAPATVPAPEARSYPTPGSSVGEPA
uniref:Uncharacterized protein n=1 Tax=Mycena chlorophos TaxID=658473 RepID=A0ABQ0LUJ4_MYCCL|nr:predicted protein [Mycena chlorophos]